MDAFTDSLNDVLRYGLAPLPDVQSFITQVRAERDDPEGDHRRPEQALEIMRDFLDDHDDPRLPLLERHLEHKRTGEWNWGDELDNDLMKRMGLTKTYTVSKWNHPEIAYGGGVPIGRWANVEAERFVHKPTGKAVNRVVWRIPDKTKGESYDGDFPIAANMTDEEVAALYKKMEEHRPQ